MTDETDTTHFHSVTTVWW